MFRLSDRSKKSLSTVVPIMTVILEGALADANCPYDVVVTEGGRTLARQKELYAQGRFGNKGPKVTWTKPEKSKHLIKADGYGRAIDVAICGYIGPDGKYVKITTNAGMYDSKKLKIFAAFLIKYAKDRGVTIKWGGDWLSTKDTPHFEIVNL